MKKIIGTILAIVLSFSWAFPGYAGYTNVLSNTNSYDADTNTLTVEATITYSEATTNFVAVIFFDSEDLKSPLNVKYPTSVIGERGILKFAQSETLILTDSRTGAWDNMSYTRIDAYATYYIQDKKTYLHVKYVIQDPCPEMTCLKIYTCDRFGMTIYVWGSTSFSKILPAPSFAGTIRLRSMVPEDSFSAERGYPCFRFCIVGEDQKKRYAYLRMTQTSEAVNGWYCVETEVPVKGKKFTVTQKPIAVYSSDGQKTVTFSAAGQTQEVVFTEMLRKPEARVFVSVNSR